MWTVDIGGSVYPVTFGRVSTELNGHEEAFFTLENNIVTRKLVAEDRDVTIKFLGRQVFFGTLAAPEYGNQTIICKVYNKVYDLMNKKEHTQTYADPGTAANTILGNICGEVSGVSAGECPEDDVAVQYNRTSCLDAGKYLAQTVVEDFWSSGGDTFNIGTRGSSKGKIVVLSVSRRTINRAKKRTKVYVRGQDEDGNAIEGTYGAGTDVVAFTERKATNVATLNSIAEYKYNQLNKDSSGVKLTSPIEYAYDLDPGDTVIIDKPELNLSGSYRIWRIKKKATVADIEIDKQEELLERFLERQRELENVGIYPIGASQFPTGMQTFSTNLEFRPLVGSPDDQVEWDNGAAGNATIRFADGTTETINVNFSAALAAGDHWAYYTIGSGQITVTSNYASVDGPNKVFLAQFTVPTVVAGQTQYVEILTTYSRGMQIGSSYLSQGVIITPDFRTAYNVGVAGGPGGIAIFNHLVDGWGIYGYSTGLTRQFYILASNGKAYFAGGKAIIDGDGITINDTSGDLITFKNDAGTVTLGWIRTINGQIRIASNGGALLSLDNPAGGDVLLSANGDFRIQSPTDPISLSPGDGDDLILIRQDALHPDPNFVPRVDGVSQLGEAALRWAELRAVDIYGADYDGITHAMLGGITTGQHHAKSHNARHVTGAADELDTQSMSPISNANTTEYYIVQGMQQILGITGRLVTSGAGPYWVASSSGGATTTQLTVSSSQSFNYGNSGDYAIVSWAERILALGIHTHAHKHNVTTSPTPDFSDAEPGDEMIEFISDELLPDGTRYIRINFPEFKMYTEVTYPIGCTDERVIKDAKNHYHALWEAKKALMLPENKPRTMALEGKKIKWDFEKEEAHMAAEAAETGDEEREENERQRLEHVRLKLLQKEKEMATRDSNRQARETQSPNCQETT